MSAPSIAITPYRFADLRAADPEAPAFLTASSTLTYAELDGRVEDVRGRLGSRRRLVLLAADNTVEAAATYLAALRGRHPLILAPRGETNAMEALAASYDPDVVASGDEILEQRPGTRHQLHPDLALLLSTSGSTGTPKLVRLSLANLVANAGAIAEYLRLTEDDRAIATLPLSYCYGLSVLNSHLHAGASVVLTDLSVVDRCFWDVFKRVGVTNFAGVPHTFELLDRIGFEAFDLPSLRFITQAGGRMPPDAVRRYADLGRRRGWELFVMYGQTEATARMAYLPPALAVEYPTAIGIPVPGGELFIRDPDAAGVGELVYRGPNVMLGYATEPPDLALGASGAELPTGDLARQRDGLFEIVGRRSRFIKPFGVRIDLDHLETVLTRQFGPTVAVTGNDDGLVVGVGPGTTADEVRRVVEHRVRLPASRVHVLQLDALPLLPNGKPDYPALQRGTEPSATGPTHDHSALRDRLVAVYSELLSADATGADTFVSLGGDSLSYVEVSVAVEEHLGALPRDWHITPIASLAASAPPPRRRLAAADTGVVLRAAAIILIVGTHTELWHHPGGAHALLAVAGYNFARFQLGTRNLGTSIARVVIPSVCWIGAVAALSDQYGWPNALLINGVVQRPQDEWGYWFVEALVQILLPLALLFSIPGVARAERRWPFAAAATALAVGLAVRFDLVDLATSYRISRPHEVFWLFALGWAAARSTSWHQRAAVSAVALVATLNFFGDLHRELIVAAGFALVAWAPTVPAPRPLLRLLTPVASASLYIYLVHFQVFPPVDRLLGPGAAVIAAVVVGIAASVVANRVTSLVSRTVRSRALRPTG